MSSKPNCINCQHYHITWDQKAPRGCKLYGIKSQAMPSQIVQMAGSGDCQGFQAKVKKEDPSKDKGLDLNRKDLW